MQSSIDDKADLKAQAAQVDQLDAQLTSLLATDVSWSHMLQDISKTMPGTVWLTSFQGAVTPAAPPAPAPAPTTDDAKASSEPPAAAAPAAPAGIQGQITFAAKGDAYPDVASWIRTVGDTNVMPSLTGLWVTGATAGDTETDSSVGFDSTANLTDAARSNRLEKYQGENQ